MNVIIANKMMRIGVSVMISLNLNDSMIKLILTSAQVSYFTKSFEWHM